jgi:8-oxo-dGTP pyrophosphatase MutT (NUDIX family)
MQMHLDDIKNVFSSKLIPNPTIPETSKPSSVLVIIFGSEPKILMTKKSSKLKLHASEISFPGGKKSSFDDDLIETALRETREEINLGIRRDQVVGQLEPVFTLNSGFAIIPYVAVVRRLPRLKDNVEVETILHIPLLQLLKTFANDPNPEHNLIKEMYTFTFDEHVVWGASARILKQIHDILSKNNLLQ